MNFLAHAVLSPSENPQIRLGNLMTDRLRKLPLAHAHRQYPPFFQLGIQLHHAIDEFTDNHGIVREIIAHFRPVFGHYAGVVSDILF
ncbi:MAG: DUF479 domain-containing protein, partial [Lentisphaerae bacterium]